MWQFFLILIIALLSPLQAEASEFDRLKLDLTVKNTRECSDTGKIAFGRYEEKIASTDTVVLRVPCSTQGVLLAEPHELEASATTWLNVSGKADQPDVRMIGLGVRFRTHKYGTAEIKARGGGVQLMIRSKF